MRPLALATAFLIPAYLFLGSGTALADGLIIIAPHPPDRPSVRNVPLAVKHHRVTVKIEGRVAITEVDQVFVNPNNHRVEGTYLFPLPEGAAMDHFGMWLDGKELVAELLDAGKARRIYEAIVRRAQDPALLEYMGRGAFKARIFPIEPRSEKRVRLRYAEVLSADNGTVAYSYQLSTEKFSSKPLEHVSIDVTIEDDAPITAVFSPTHDVDVPATLGKRVRLGWEARNVTPDRDFHLYWRPTKKDVGASLVTHRIADDGTFLLVLAPRSDENSRPLPKDVVFVVDTSGSMAGEKIEQARGALRYCLRSLGPQDRFGIIPFSTEPRPFKTTLAAATSLERTAADAFVDTLVARGGTAIDDALRMSLSMLAEAGQSERPQMVLFVTDGMPTIGKTDANEIVQRAQAVLGAARLFVFGVGNDVNTKLLDRLAAESRGTRDYVAETENIEVKVSNIYEKLSRPAMTDIELVFAGPAITAVHPRKLPDLFHGSEVLVTGRFARGGHLTMDLRGKVRGQTVRIVEEFVLPEREERNKFLPRLWAVRRVGFLLDEIRLHGESGELKDEVVRLAKQYGIVTPYTSYLILEDDAVVPADGPTTGGGRHFFGRGGGGGAPRPPGARAPSTEEDAARDRVGREAGAAGDAGEAESGEGAVGFSKEAKSLSEFRGDRDDEATGGKDVRNALVRHLHGRTFVQRGAAWWDAKSKTEKAPRVIAAFGDEYFALIRKHEWLARYLVLGRVVIEVDGEMLSFGG